MHTTTQLHRAARKILIIGLTALTLGTASTDVLASPPSVTVSFAGLDLSRPAGAQVLYQRIERAAFEVCDVFVGGRFPEARAKASTCYKDAVANAVAQVNSPQLSAIHRARMLRLATY